MDIIKDWWQLEIFTFRSKDFNGWPLWFCVFFNITRDFVDILSLSSMLMTFRPVIWTSIKQCDNSRESAGVRDLIFPEGLTEDNYTDKAISTVWVSAHFSNQWFLTVFGVILPPGPVMLNWIIVVKISAYHHEPVWFLRIQLDFFFFRLEYYSP